MPEHLVGLPRLQRVHEGQGPAGRALHHQPDLRHLRRQPCDLLGLRTEHGVRHQTAAARRLDHQPRRGRRVHVRPHDLPGQPGVRRLLRADGRRDEPGPAGDGEEHRRAARLRPRLPDDRRHHGGVQPVRGLGLQGGPPAEPHHPRDDLPDGGAARPPVHPLSRRRGDGRDAAGVHRLPRPADALPRLRQARRRDERRHLRLLPGGAARLRPGRAAADAARLLGRVPEPRRLRLRLPAHVRVGARRLRHPRDRRGRAAPHHRPGRHQPRHADPAGQLVLRRLGQRRDVRQGGPARQPRRPAAPVEPDDAASPAEARPGRRQVQLGDEPAVEAPGDRRPSRARHRRRAARPAVGDRAGGEVDTPYVRSTGHSVQIDLPKTPGMPEVNLEWTPPRYANTIERDRARAYFIAYAAGMALFFAEKALDEVRAGRTKVFTDFEVPEEAIGCGFHEAVRGVLSHHLVIRDHKIANYHPYPPTPWNASPRDSYGTPGPYEDAVAASRSSRRTGRTTSRASTSCGPSAASTRACRAACTCTSAAAGRSRSGTRRCSARRTGGTDGLGRRARPGARPAPRRAARTAGPGGRAGRPGAGGAVREALDRVVRSTPDLSALTGDELVGHLLLTHGLHPESPETRVGRALGAMDAFLGKHRTSVEFSGIEGRRCG